MKKSIILVLLGFLGTFLCDFALAATNELKHLEIQPIYPDKIQVVLQFSESVVPQSFSIENPPNIVFDFPNVSNRLTKELSMQKLNMGILKQLNVFESEKKTRMILDLKQMVPFESQVEGKTFKVTLETGEKKETKEAATTSNVNAINSSKYNQILSFDFRRGERGEGRIVVNLSNPKAIIDLKDSSGKIVANFAGTNIEDRLARRYDVTDFATPVKSVVLSKKGDDVNMVIESRGQYDKIAYQMDNQYIIEVRDIGKAEQSKPKEFTGEYLGERISLNFQDIEIRAVLQIIADFAGFNVITSDSVKGNITLRLHNVPWDQALDIILKTKNLDKRRYGNIVLIGPTDEIAAREKAELESQKQLEQLGPLQSELIEIKYANAEDLVSILKEKANSLMTARGNVTVDKRTNTLLVQDIAAKITEIRSLIKKLDIPVRQVEIATQIVTADNTLEYALGIRFGGAANAGIGGRQLGIGSSIDRARAISAFQNGTTVPNPNVNYTLPSTSTTISANNATTLATNQNVLKDMNIIQGPFNGPGPTVNNTEGLFSDLGALTAGTIFGATGLTPAKIGFALAKLPNGTLLDLELQALEFCSESKIVARPKLVTMDQNKASVEQGVDIPYLQASSSGATSVAYKTAALKLEVTPHITPDDKISMDLQVSHDTQGVTVAAGPTVNTNRIQTKVLVDNGQTIVLGGVLQIIDNKQRGRVPFLGDLPIIGFLFKNKYTRYSPKELIIFLTPKIINPSFELHKVEGRTLPFCQGPCDILPPYCE